MPRDPSGAKRSVGEELLQTSRDRLRHALHHYSGISGPDILRQRNLIAQEHRNRSGKRFRSRDAKIF